MNDWKAWALATIADKLDDAIASGADYIGLDCPNCGRRRLQTPNARPPLTLRDVLDRNRSLVAAAPAGVRAIYKMNREYWKSVTMNEDQCPNCRKWVQWNRNGGCGDFRFHACSTGERWVMSVHGAPVRIADANDPAAEPDCDSVGPTTPDPGAAA